MEKRSSSGVEGAVSVDSGMACASSLSLMVV